jgi:hypothetical protein
VVSRRIFFFGGGVALGYEQADDCCCGPFDRETVELFTKHSDTGFISVETILYTHITHSTEALL